MRSPRVPIVAMSYIHRIPTLASDGNVSTALLRTDPGSCSTFQIRIDRDHRCHLTTTGPWSVIEYELAFGPGRTVTRRPGDGSEDVCSQQPCPIRVGGDRKLRSAILDGQVDGVVGRADLVSDVLGRVLGCRFDGTHRSRNILLL